MRDTRGGVPIIAIVITGVILRITAGLSSWGPARMRRDLIPEEPDDAGDAERQEMRRGIRADDLLDREDARHTGADEDRKDHG